MSLSAAAAVDHLIAGVADLDAGIAWFAERFGTSPVVGGSHPGRGTRNALLSLGGRQYLEIVATDPAQEKLMRPELASFAEPRLIGWAAATPSVSELSRRIASAGLEVSDPRPGSRNRPDGRQVQWTTLNFSTQFARGGIDPVPFFIEWGSESVHPSQDSPRGGSLASLTFEHPDAEALQRTLAHAGIEATVKAGEHVRVIASLQTSKGPFTLT